ncbi:MAG: hypothetical protein KKD35_07595 [Elusimicrobia bacterium]|nr:hypothetical protein [Elusimicrobiota bacterium]
MNTKNENHLETDFNSICENTKTHQAPDLWPKIKTQIEKSEKGFSLWKQSLWSKGLVFACFAVIITLAIPGATETIKNGLKKLFSSNYSLQIGRSDEISGTFIIEEGEIKKINTKDILVEIKMTSLDEKAVKINVSVFKKQKDGSLKLYSKPAIVALRNTLATISVTDQNGVPIYKIGLTPSEKPAKYKGSFQKLESDD